MRGASALSDIASPENRISTIEDPVESQLPRGDAGADERGKGLTLARGLRSVLRHDPDHAEAPFADRPELAILQEDIGDLIRDLADTVSGTPGARLPMTRSGVRRCQLPVVASTVGGSSLRTGGATASAAAEYGW